MLADWERQYPGRVESIFTSLCNVTASQLADPALFDFAALEASRALAAAQPAAQPALQPPALPEPVA